MASPTFPDLEERILKEIENCPVKLVEVGEIVTR